MRSFLNKFTKLFGLVGCLIALLFLLDWRYTFYPKNVLSANLMKLFIGDVNMDVEHVLIHENQPFNVKISYGYNKLIDKMFASLELRIMGELHKVDTNTFRFSSIQGQVANNLSFILHSFDLKTGISTPNIVSIPDAGVSYTDTWQPILNDIYLLYDLNRAFLKSPNDFTITFTYRGKMKITDKNETKVPLISSGIGKPRFVPDKESFAQIIADENEAVLKIAIGMTTDEVREVAGKERTKITYDSWRYGDYIVKFKNDLVYNVFKDPLTTEGNN